MPTLGRQTRVDRSGWIRRAAARVASGLRSLAHLVPRTSDKWSALFAGAGLLLVAVSIYVDKVLIVDHLRMTIVDADFRDAKIRTEMLLSNVGNRQAAFLGGVVVAPVVASGKEEAGAAWLGAPVIVEESDQRPVVISPGEVRRIVIVQSYDLTAAYKDRDQGRKTSENRKVVKFEMSMQCLDSFGHILHVQLPLIDYEVGPSGPLRGLGTGMVRPVNVYRRFHWLGALRSE